MAVPKKRISRSKKHIRSNIWKKKRYLTVVKALSLAKLVSTGHSKSFFVQQKSNKIVE